MKTPGGEGQRKGRGHDIENITRPKKKDGIFPICAGGIGMEGIKTKILKGR